MKVNKKLFLVFVMAFSLALAGGSVFSTHASANCDQLVRERPVLVRPVRV